MDATWRLKRHIAEEIRKQWPHGPVRLLVAVSGGADSVCLLHLLAALAESTEIRLSCCHVHHGIRGEAADADQAFVETLCRQLRVPFRAVAVDAPARARTGGLTLEDAARRERYEALRRIAREKGADAIVLAHHRDDQAETVLLHVLRGAASEGLQGMLAFRNGLFRPLLDLPGADLRACLRENGWDWCEDATNADTVHRRNALRNQVLPWLRERLGHDPAGPLARFASIQQEEQALLGGLAEQAACEAGLAGGVALPSEAGCDASVPQANGLESEDGCPTTVRFRSEALARLHPALARRVVFLAWHRATGSRNGMETVHAASVVALCRSRHEGARLSLPNGMQACISGDMCLLVPAGPTVGSQAAAWAYPVLWPDVAGAVRTTDVPEAGGRLVVTRLAREAALAAYPAGRGTERGPVQLVDSSVAVAGIFIRNRRAGDRIHPWRAPGDRRLKDWFIDRKVPASVRDRMPLVADGGRILWIVGHRTAETLGAAGARGDVFELAWRPLEWPDMI